MMCTFRQTQYLPSFFCVLFSKFSEKTFVIVIFFFFFSFSLPKKTVRTECYLSQVGKPVLYAEYNSTEYIAGCWMRDPAPVKEKDREKYWLTRIEYNNLLQEFDSKEAFRNKQPTVNYTLLHRFTGNAQTVYGGRFYYAEEGTNKVVIFSLDTLDSAFVSLVPASSASSSSSSSSAHHHNLPRRPRATARHVRSHHHWRRSSKSDKERHPQQPSSSSPLTSRRLYRNQLNAIDISVDENGIWLLYPNLYSEANTTIVMKLNGTRPEYVWNLTIDYGQLGETFILCGVLYGVESTVTAKTHLAFAYDLYANRELSAEMGVERVAFTNPFLSTVYIGYNPLYRYLYTWDSGSMLEYLLKIDATMSTTTSSKQAAKSAGDDASSATAADEEEK